MDLSSSKLNKFNFNYRDAFSMITQSFFLSTRNWNVLQNLERRNANLGTQKKVLKKHAGTRNAKRK